MNEKIQTLLRILLLSVFIPSTFLLLQTLAEDRDAEKSHQEAVMIAMQQDSLPPETTCAVEIPETTTAPTAPPTIRWVPAPIDEDDPNLKELKAIDLEALREINPDVLGWILIPDTAVNYPVLQGEDNDYYLDHTWKEKPSYIGSIFLECQNSPDFSDYNTIIYGHNLRNGTMFATVRKYMKQSFYDAHPHVYLVTDGGIFRYDIFSAHLAALDSLTYGMVMNREQTRQDFLEYALAESVIDTPIVPSLTDSIITLSTCSGQGYSSRWVVHARLEKIPATE